MANKYEDYTDKNIKNKQDFATEHAENVSYEVLDAVLEQIQFCEELGKGLSESKILELLKLKTEFQVERACHDLKIA